MQLVETKHHHASAILVGFDSTSETETTLTVAAHVCLRLRLHLHCAFNSRHQLNAIIVNRGFVHVHNRTFGFDLPWA